MRKNFFAENTLPSAVAMMAAAIEFLRAQGLNARSLFIAELVLEEMLTNTVKYGYDDEESHRIEVMAEVVGEDVLLELIDDGHYFDPRSAAAPKAGVPLASRVQGGCGIHLVRKLVDRFDYRREGDRNIVRLGFPAAAPEAVTAR